MTDSEHDCVPHWIRFDRSICGNLDEAECREWWLTNGRGGYAGGTLAGTLTRRYHGLLVTPLRPPLDRRLLVARADARVLAGDQEWSLHTNRWQSGAIEPQGYRHIESFQLDGRLPTWRFSSGEMQIESSIWLEPETDVSWIGWRLCSGGNGVETEPVLAVDILANVRSHHGNTEALSLHPDLSLDDGRLVVRFADTALHVRAVGGTLALDETWVENFYLAQEAARGLPAVDNVTRRIQKT